MKGSLQVKSSPTAKEFEELSLVDRVVIVEKLQVLWERLMIVRLNEARDLRIGKRLPPLNALYYIFIILGVQYLLQ